MTISAVEAKEKCIAMWEHIAENITDKEWRGKTYNPEGWKRKAIEELGWIDERPIFNCYICAVCFCPECPLGPGCDPYGSFCSAATTSHYARASAAAKRLVEKVRAWEVEA